MTRAQGKKVASLKAAAIAASPSTITNMATTELTLEHQLVQAKARTYLVDSIQKGELLPILGPTLINMLDDGQIFATLNDKGEYLWNVIEWLPRLGPAKADLSAQQCSKRDPATV